MPFLVSVIDLRVSIPCQWAYFFAYTEVDSFVKRLVHPSIPQGERIV